MAYTFFVMVMGIFAIWRVASQSQDIECYCVNKSNVTYIVHCSDGISCSWQSCSCAATVKTFTCPGRPVCKCSCTYVRESRQRSNILQCKIWNGQFQCMPIADCSRRVLFSRNITTGQGGRLPFDADRLSVDPEDISEILRYNTSKVHEERVIAALQISPFIYNMTHKLQCLSDFLGTCTDGIITEECTPELTLQESNQVTTTTVSVIPVTKDEPATSYGIGAVLGAFIGGAALTLVIGLAMLFSYRTTTSPDQGRNVAPGENAQIGQDYSDINEINFQLAARPTVPQTEANTPAEIADHGNFSGVSPPDLPSNAFPRIGNMYHNTGTTDSSRSQNDKPGYDFTSGNGIEAADAVDYTTLQIPRARAKDRETDRKPCGSTGNGHDENQFGDDKSDNEKIETSAEFKLGDDPGELDNNGYFLLEMK